MDLPLIWWQSGKGVPCFYWKILHYKEGETKSMKENFLWWMMLNLNTFRGVKSNYSAGTLAFCVTPLYTFFGGVTFSCTHHQTSDPQLCLIKTWCRIIRWLISYPTSSPDTTVNSYQLDNGSIHTFSRKELLIHLRMA